MKYICKMCGKDLGEANSDGEYICPSCGLRVKEDYKDMKATIEQSLDNAKQQSIANARRNMWDAICKEYLSDDIVKWSDKILEFLPDDFYANFYKTIYTADKNSLNDYIKNIDVKANYASIESMVDFILKAIDDVNLLPLNNLVERAYKGIDNAMFERVSTKVSDKAEKINNGVYNLTISRDVFIIYSSKDMDKVEQVVEAFESNGISCFVAMRNLRHGRGARDSYAEALEVAMSNCKTVVFVSTPNSRDMYCDTLRVELPYLKAYDIAGFPQYRNNYESMPNDLKKFRVQLVLGEWPDRTKIADIQADLYFAGYEYCYAIDEAITRVYTSITEIRLPKNNVENKAQEENLQVISNANAAVSALIEKARVQIEDEDYADAEATCDKISDLDIKNADLWICKLLIEAKVADLETLATVAINLEDSKNYKKAIRFGNEQQKVECKNAVEKAKFLVAQEQMRKEA
ncbi:MAG: toll/interleukin-1 receptor domain-containing protein, partial [Clostridia bacterium]